MNPEDAINSLGSSTIKALRTLEILLTESDERYIEESKLMATWGNWSTLTRLYNFSTRVNNEKEVHNSTLADEKLNIQSISDPPPERFPKFEPSEIRLTRKNRNNDSDVTLSKILENRRTVRRFNNNSIDLSILSEILEGSVSTSQKRPNNPDDDKYENYFRSAPSGGARASTEVRLIAQKIRDLPRASYRYNPRRHSLVKEGSALSLDNLTAGLIGQHWIAKCPAIIVYSVQLKSLMWKYSHSRAYRVGLLDAGHLNQSLIMTAWSLGVSANFTGLLQEPIIERELAIDPASEALIGICGLGYASDLDPRTQGFHD